MSEIFQGSPRQSLSIRNDLRPGDVSSISDLHVKLYAEQGWDHTFDAYVFLPLSEFARSHSARERLWIVEDGKKIVGSIAIVKFSKKEAQLRWLLLEPEFRGRGLGRQLLKEALDFCQAARYSSVFLWTVSQLNIAAQLYQSFGFRKTQELTHELWGRTVTEIRYDLIL